MDISKFCGYSLFIILFYCFIEDYSTTIDSYSVRDLLFGKCSYLESYHKFIYVKFLFFKFNSNLSN